MGRLGGVRRLNLKENIVFPLPSAFAAIFLSDLLVANRANLQLQRVTLQVYNAVPFNGMRLWSTTPDSRRTIFRAVRRYYTLFSAQSHLSQPSAGSTHTRGTFKSPQCHSSPSMFFLDRPRPAPTPEPPDVASVNRHLLFTL